MTRLNVDDCTPKQFRWWRDRMVSALIASLIVLCVLLPSAAVFQASSQSRRICGAYNRAVEANQASWDWLFDVSEQSNKRLVEDPNTSPERKAQAEKTLQDLPDLRAQQRKFFKHEDC